MSTHPLIDIIDGQRTFAKPIQDILAEVPRGGAIKTLSPAEYITERQRAWYKGVCLRELVKHDENGEPEAWWDREVKKLCHGLAYLKKEIFFVDDGAGGCVPFGRLTTKGVGKQNMTKFIEDILSEAMHRGWPVSAPDPELRRQ